jgi:hypothetical protein
MDLKKYMVETVSIFRIRYVVEAKEATHATDEVVMRLSDTDFDEFSQYHVDEVISSVREISDEDYLNTFNEDNDYLKNWSDEQKFGFVHRIDYKEEALEELSKIHQELDSLCGDPDCCGVCNDNSK